MTRDPRPLGLGAAAIIAGHAVVVGLISAAAGAGDLSPPEVVPAPLTLAALLSLPAGIAAIGAWRRSGPILAAAGVLCLVQSVIAFSGVTIPFVVPGILLLGVAGRSGMDAPAGRAATIGAILVVVLAVASWLAYFGMTETACWIARSGPSGELVYRLAPVSDSGTLAIDDVASGCDGGSRTLEGIALATVLSIGAVAVAAMSSRPTPTALGSRP